jgi:chaperonin GroES
VIESLLSPGPQFQSPPDLGAQPGQGADIIPFPEQQARRVPEIFKWIDKPNIAEDLSPEILSRIGMRAMDEFRIDNNSRAEWKQKVDAALKLALQKTSPKMYPWPGAASIIWPLLTTASNEFAARAYPAIIQGRNVVKGTVIGSDKGIPFQMNGQVQMGPAGKPLWIQQPGVKRARADKIGAHMSWQLLSEMKDWETQTDLLLHVIPIIGCAARKSFYDPSLRYNCSQYVSMLDLVVNYNAKSFDSAPRISEQFQLYPNEIEERIRSGLFREFQYGQAAQQKGYENDPDAPHDFIEQHRWWDLDKDGYQEPYIVTIHKETSRVVRIVARYDQDSIKLQPDGTIWKIEAIQYYTLYQFLPNPESTIYGLGFGHLLGPINEAINTTLNQMFDAGHLQNTGGGFIASGLSMNTGAVRFRVGQYNPVNSMGMALRDSIYTMDFKGPSPVLFQLLGILIEAGKEVASIKDILTGNESPAGTSPVTMMALIEQGLRGFSDIYKRIYRSFKAEFGKLYDLNGKYLAQGAGYQQGDEWQEITPDDYKKGSGVEPVGDPTAVTDMQQLGRAGYLMQFYGKPGINDVAVTRRALEAGQINDLDEVLNDNPQPPPLVQLAMQEKTAEIGKIRAQESQAYATGIFQLAQARKLSSDAELEFLDAQLEHMRLGLEASNTHIASINTSIRAMEAANKADHLANVRTSLKARSNGQ